MSLTLTKDEFEAQSAAVDKAARRHRFLFGLGAFGIILYLIFSYISFDIPAVRAKWNPERAALYMLDTYAYKDHVTMRWSEPEKLEVSLEGSFQAVYDETNMPEWFTVEDDARTVSFENGGLITIYNDYVEMDWPGYDEIFTFELNADGKPYVVGYDGREDALPEFMRRTANKVEVRPSLRERLQVGTSKVEVHRYEIGWEHFWFDFDSPLRDHGFWDGIGLMFSGERIVDTISEDARDDVGLNPGDTMSNAKYVWSEFRDNQIWGHGVVLWAMVETIFMALLGTMVAAIYGLPMAFIAAKNTSDKSIQTAAILAFLIWIPVTIVIIAETVVTTSTWMMLLSLLIASVVSILAFIGILVASYLICLVLPIRFITRRLFDLLRGIDTLIWSLIFLRAFGPGLFTGIFAIAFTDTGTLGKLMSEAIENADNKQREGIQSTGANKVQQHRFGILPQIMPVFISQSLYYLESNTRGAVIIGAMGAGGIGLQFLGALNTRNDFENVTYMAILVLLTVVVMDWGSAKLRRTLIGGDAR